MSEAINDAKAAWVRNIPDTFDQAITGPRGRAPDVALALAQHDDYVTRLRESGLSVSAVAADPSYPDCVFIEDTAVLIGDPIAVVARPGAPERRGEVDAVHDALVPSFEVIAIEPPGTLDGGDVMVIGDIVYVGLSARTNQLGAGQLASIASEIGLRAVTVPVSGVLHLKSGALPVSEDTIVVTKGTVEESLFEGLRIVHEDPEERHLFSALPLSDRVLTTAQAPTTNALVERLGLAVDPIDVSEILAVDGGLTCMSIIER
ncbi:MAG TPA: arginine deiminase-related protein [Acidimicrobiia bacterium]|nr:arginine deiminase-related protein [Acidimicrobiia bacterium]